MNFLMFSKPEINIKSLSKENIHIEQIPVLLNTHLHKAYFSPAWIFSRL